MYMGAALTQYGRGPAFEALPPTLVANRPGRGTVGSLLGILINAGERVNIYL